MTRTEMTARVRDTLRGLLVSYRLEVPEVFDLSKCVTSFGLETIEGFDFICAIEAAAGVTIPENVNPFVDDEEHRYRSVAEIVDLLCVYNTAGEEAGDGKK